MALWLTSSPPISQSHMAWRLGTGLSFGEDATCSLPPPDRVPKEQGGSIFIIFISGFGVALWKEW